MELDRHADLVGGAAGCGEDVRRAGVHLAGGKHGAHQPTMGAIIALAEGHAVLEAVTPRIRIGMVDRLKVRPHLPVEGSVARADIAADAEAGGDIGDALGGGDIATFHHLEIEAQLHHGGAAGQQQLGEGTFGRHQFVLPSNGVADCRQDAIEPPGTGTGVGIAHVVEQATGERRVRDMQMRVDESGNDQPAGGVDAHVHSTGIVGADVDDLVILEDDAAGIEVDMASTLKCDDPAVIDRCPHRRLHPRLKQPDSGQKLRLAQEMR